MLHESVQGIGETIEALHEMLEILVDLTLALGCGETDRSHFSSHL